MKSIGEVAHHFGLPAHVLRHWESEGLLTPARQGDRRRYTEADMFRVRAIMLAKEAGFALADIRTILTARTAAVRHEVTARHMAALAERIAKAQAAMAMLEGGLECPHDDVMTCPRFHARLTSSTPAPVPAR